MSKELTPLEALERIGKLKVEGLRAVPTKTTIKDYNDYYIVETAIKDYDMLLEEYNLMKKEYGFNKKKLKALEIIKEHFVKIGGTRGNLEGKNPKNEFVIALKDLTEEEFVSLKEVLL